jgi:hypothetical protein
MKTILAILSAVLVLVGGYMYLQEQRKDPVNTYEWLLNPEASDRVALFVSQHFSDFIEFRRLFPRSRLSIWPSFPRRRGSLVVAEAIVHGRYQIELSQDIRTDKASYSAVALGSPRLSIMEIASLEKSKEHGWSTTFGPQHLNASWPALLSANGNLSSVISNPILDRPLWQADAYASELYDQWPGK